VKADRAVCAVPDSPGISRNTGPKVSALSHPNIVSVFDVGTDHGRSYVVAELLEGGNYGLGPILLSPDEKAYAYNYESVISELHVMEGAL
jgi:serine/threonine protein kinase